jgi:Holliday junction resolvase
MPRRTDANQREIVKTFRDLGASVQILSDVGKGCPDIVVGIFGKNFLIEIKDGKKCPSAQKLTEMEYVFFQYWKGQVSIIKSSQEVVEFINNLQM